MNLLDPNISIEEISDEFLIEEFNNPSVYKKRNLYALMSVRANYNFTIRRCLLELVLNEKARKEIEFGIIAHAWLPVLLILKHGNDELKFELKETLRSWTLEERELLVSYAKNDEEYSNFICDIVDEI